jgi:FSR family fosmidomycin resistance protein-like MFS transporter
MNDAQNKAGGKADVGLLAAGHFLGDVYGSLLVTLMPVWVSLFDLSFSAAGFLVFLRSAGMTFFEPVCGHLADTTRRQIFPLGLLLAAVTMSALGLVPSYAALLLLVFVSTVGSSIFGPQAVTTARRSSGSFRGLGVAIFLAGGSLGAAVGPISVATLVDRLGIRSTWLLVLPGLLLAIVLSKRFAPRAVDPNPAKSAVDVRVLLRSRPVLALAGVLLLRGAAETGILAFLPILVEQKGGTLITAGATLSVFKLSGAVGAIVAGFLSDRWTGKPLMLVSFLLSVVFLYGFVQVDGTVALILIALLGGALLSSSAYTMVVAQDLLPGRHSTAAGLFWSISLLGGGLGALVEGFLADGFGVETALLLLGVPLPLAAAALTLGIRDRFPAG